MANYPIFTALLSNAPANPDVFDAPSVTANKIEISPTQLCICPPPTIEHNGKPKTVFKQVLDKQLEQALTLTTVLTNVSDNQASDLRSFEGQYTPGLVDSLLKVISRGHYVPISLWLEKPILFKDPKSAVDATADSLVCVSEDFKAVYYSTRSNTFVFTLGGTAGDAARYEEVRAKVLGGKTPSVVTTAFGGKTARGAPTVFQINFAHAGASVCLFLIRLEEAVRSNKPLDMSLLVDWPLPAEYPNLHHHLNLLLYRSTTDLLYHPEHEALIGKPKPPPPPPSLSLLPAPAPPGLLSRVASAATTAAATGVTVVSTAATAAASVVTGRVSTTSSEPSVEVVIFDIAPTDIKLGQNYKFDRVGLKMSDEYRQLVWQYSRGETLVRLVPSDLGLKGTFDNGLGKKYLFNDIMARVATYDPLVCGSARNMTLKWDSLRWDPETDIRMFAILMAALYKKDSAIAPVIFKTRVLPFNEVRQSLHLKFVALGPKRKVDDMFQLVYKPSRKSRSMDADEYNEFLRALGLGTSKKPKTPSKNPQTPSKNPQTPSKSSPIVISSSSGSPAGSRTPAVRAPASTTKSSPVVLLSSSSPPSSPAGARTPAVRVPTSTTKHSPVDLISQEEDAVVEVEEEAVQSEEEDEEEEDEEEEDDEEEDEEEEDEEEEDDEETVQSEDDEDDEDNEKEEDDEQSDASEEYPFSKDDEEKGGNQDAKDDNKGEEEDDEVTSAMGSAEALVQKALQEWERLLAKFTEVKNESTLGERSVFNAIHGEARAAVAKAVDAIDAVKKLGDENRGENLTEMLRPATDFADEVGTFITATYESEPALPAPRVTLGKAGRATLSDKNKTARAEALKVPANLGAKLQKLEAGPIKPDRSITLHGMQSVLTPENIRDLNSDSLNGEIIDAFIFLNNVGQGKSYFTFSFHVMRSFELTRKVEYPTVFPKEVADKKIRFFIVPINTYDGHWICACVDTENREIAMLDSFKGENLPQIEMVAQFFDKYKKAGPWTYLTEHAVFTNIKIQNNTSDCGIYVCLYIKLLATFFENSPEPTRVPYADIFSTFTTANVAQQRTKLKHDILAI